MRPPSAAAGRAMIDAYPETPVPDPAASRPPLRPGRSLAAATRCRYHRAVNRTAEHRVLDAEPLPPNDASDPHASIPAPGGLDRPGAEPIGAPTRAEVRTRTPRRPALIAAHEPVHPYPASFDPERARAVWQNIGRLRGTPVRRHSFAAPRPGEPLPAWVGLAALATLGGATLTALWLGLSEPAAVAHQREQAEHDVRVEREQARVKLAALAAGEWPGHAAASRDLDRTPTAVRDGTSTTPGTPASTIPPRPATSRLASTRRQEAGRQEAAQLAATTVGTPSQFAADASGPVASRVTSADSSSSRRVPPASATPRDLTTPRDPASQPPKRPALPAAPTTGRTDMPPSAAGSVPPRPAALADSRRRSATTLAPESRRRPVTTPTADSGTRPVSVAARPYRAGSMPSAPPRLAAVTTAAGTTAATAASLPDDRLGEATSRYHRESRATAKLPVSPRDRAPIGPIGASGIHLDRLTLATQDAAGKCALSTSEFVAGRDEWATVCFRIVHARQAERVTVLWEHNGQVQRRARIHVPATHAHNTRARMRLWKKTIKPGTWTVRIVSDDNVELAMRTFEVTKLAGRR
ncbi:MAG: DUF2914 domain-containing protein [Myxococcales bacterium FL481]|nr:MAG: DUF2914 domain-containing protein [Myxococcales bacterium FL481]